MADNTNPTRKIKGEFIRNRKNFRLEYFLTEQFLSFLIQQLLFMTGSRTILQPNFQPKQIVIIYTFHGLALG